MATDQVRFKFNLTPENHEFLTKLSAAQHLTRTMVIHNIFRAYLKTVYIPPADPSLPPTENRYRPREGGQLKDVMIRMPDDLAQQLEQVWRRINIPKSQVLDILIGALRACCPELPSG